MSTLGEIGAQLHELARFERLGGVDTFFGRMELFESEMGRRHIEAGETHWHRPGRYGNIVAYEPTLATIDYCLEQGWEPSWLFELSKWYNGQAKSYGSPDCAVLSVFIDIHLKRKGFEKPEE